MITIQQLYVFLYFYFISFIVFMLNLPYVNRNNFDYNALRMGAFNVFVLRLIIIRIIVLIVVKEVVLWLGILLPPICIQLSHLWGAHKLNKFKFYYCYFFNCATHVVHLVATETHWLSISFFFPYHWFTCCHYNFTIFSLRNNHMIFSSHTTRPLKIQMTINN